MTRTVAAVALLVGVAAVAGCSPVPQAAPSVPLCPTYREVSGVYVMDGQGARPCLIPPSTPGPTLSAGDYGVLWQQPAAVPWVTVDRAAPRPPLGH